MIYKGRGYTQLTGRNSMAVNLGSVNSATGYGALPSITLNGSSGSNTINLGSGAASIGLTAQSVASIDPIIFKWHETNVKRYEIIESKQDILALSVAWARHRKEPSPKLGFDNMLEDRLFDYVNDEDVAHANKIRDYYAKKYTVLALKNIELSSFRNDLKDIILTDGKKFKETLIPIAYRMPEFYEYDLEFEELLFQYNREVKSFDETTLSQVKKLSLVKTFMVNNKKQKRKEYWFKDEHDNLVSYFVDVSNPLRGLLDAYVENDIRVAATFQKRSRDGYEFIKMTQVNFG